MNDLRQTESGIYYIYDYYPTKYKMISEEQDALRHAIWDYKKQDHAAMNRFTNDLMEAITQICKQIRSTKIGLVAVPPSKVDKKSPMRISIWNIHQWYEKGLILPSFGCNKTIYDYGKLLTRFIDVPTAHEGVRASYEEQKCSIKCSRDQLWRYGTVFFILDDVTTLGTSMDVCRDILVDHGSVIEKIYRLAIARTV